MASEDVPHLFTHSFWWHQAGFLANSHCRSLHCIPSHQNPAMQFIQHAPEQRKCCGYHACHTSGQSRVHRSEDGGGVGGREKPARGWHANSGELHGIGAIEERVGGRGRWRAAPRVAPAEQLAWSLPKVADLVLHRLALPATPPLQPERHAGTSSQPNTLTETNNVLEGWADLVLNLAALLQYHYWP